MFTINIIKMTTDFNFTYIYIITLSHTFVKNYFKNKIEVSNAVWTRKCR